MFVPYLTSWLFLILAGQDVATANDPQVHLDELVQRYMLLEDKSKRADIVKQIKREKNLTPQRVDKAIRHVQLWQALPQRDGTFVWTDRNSQQHAGSYRLPANYDPEKSYPLILGDLPNWFGESDAYIVVALPADLPVDFHQSPADYADLLSMLLEVRHRIHVDTQRVFLCAPAKVGWLVMMTYPDVFAGAIFHGSPVWWPYAGQLYPILLENFHDVPVLWVLRNDQDETAALLSSFIQYQVSQRKLPFEIKLLDNGQTAFGLESESDWFSKMAGNSLPYLAKRISHWYRFPSQGQASWLSADKYKGEPWTASQLSIAVNPTVDRDVYITRVLKEKLAYLGGQVVGQSIEIQTRRCERVVWRLYEHSIDWTKPITVTCNGQRRFEGKAKPSIATMLEFARASWDFSRPVWSSRKIAIRSDAPDL